MDPKRHTRGPSTDERIRNRPRSSTKGPLDVNDPLGTSPGEPKAAHSLLEVRLKSKAQIPSIHDQPPLDDLFKLDLGFLLRPELYHPLSHQVSYFNEQVNLQDIPPPFLNAENSHSSFRAQAVQAVQDLMSSSSDDYLRIFHLLYVRLSALVLINATSLAAREAKALEDFHSSPVYRHPHTGVHLAPWELRVLAVRLQSLAFNDWRRGIMGIYELGREARSELAHCPPADREMWKLRLEDLAVRTASTLVEMGDMEGAVRHLNDLQIPRLKLSLALLYLRCGQIEQAERCAGSDQIVKALSKMANGDFLGAAETWTGTDPMVMQNKAVCYLYAGEMEKTRSILENVLDEYPPFYAQTFNLCTIYELCSDQSKELKTKLAEDIARRYPDMEIYNSDFKL